MVLGAKVRKFEDGKQIEVMIGIKENPQFIRYIKKDVVEPYKGDHLCIYVNDFLPMYDRAKHVMIGRENAKTVSIVWNNPCLNKSNNSTSSGSKISWIWKQEMLSTSLSMNSGLWHM